MPRLKKFRPSLVRKLLSELATLDLSRPSLRIHISWELFAGFVHTPRQPGNTYRNPRPKLLSNTPDHRHRQETTGCVVQQAEKVSKRFGKFLVLKLFSLFYKPNQTFVCCGPCPPQPTKLAAELL